MTAKQHYIILAKDPSVENWEFMEEGKAGSPEEAVKTLLSDYDLSDRTQLKVYNIQTTPTGEPEVYRRGDLHLPRSSP